jgi:hypothetical protein
MLVLNMLVDFQGTTFYYMPEDRTVHEHGCGNLRSYILSCVSVTIYFQFFILVLIFGVYAYMYGVMKIILPWSYIYI